MAIAHNVIEYVPEDGDLVRIERGAEVSEDIPGYDELVANGAISDEEYDPAVAKPAPPEELVVDGTLYRRAEDGATQGASVDVG